MGTAKIAQTTTRTMLLMMITTTMLHAVLEQGASAFAPGPVSPASAPGPASQDCLTILLGLSDCLSYVEPGSNLTKPEKPCCPELAGLVKSNPICLCTLLDNSTASNLGIQIDFNRALKLPTVCKVKTPPASACPLVGIPVGAPKASEAPGSGHSAPTSPPTPNSGASNTANSVMAFLAGMVIALLPI